MARAPATSSETRYGRSQCCRNRSTGELLRSRQWESKRQAQTCPFHGSDKKRMTRVSRFSRTQHVHEADCKVELPNTRCFAACIIDCRFCTFVPNPDPTERPHAWSIHPRIGDTTIVWLHEWSMVVRYRGNTIPAKMITVLTRYRPIVLELI